MADLIDELSPAYVGAQAIRLVAADIKRPVAFNAVDLQVSIQPTAKDALRVGLKLPLELTVTAPSPSGFFRHVYRSSIPSTITFTPKEGGEHLVRIREIGHNLWWGALVVDVAGERADPRTA